MIDWARVDELRAEIGAEDFAEVAALFFDEADSLLSRRVPAGESCSTSINQNRNTLMQELDRFDGVVIVTTNLFENYDPALLRRIQRHIKFRLPDASMRRELFALHLPNSERVRADFATGTLWFAARGQAEHRVEIAPDKRADWRVEADFIDSIRERRPVHLTDFATGVRYMAFTEAVWESWTRGGSTTRSSRRSAGGTIGSRARTGCTSPTSTTRATNTRSASR